MPAPIRFRPVRTGAAMAVLATAACRDVTVPLQDPATVSYAPSLNVALADFTKLPSGVYVDDVAIGSGAVVTDSSTVSIRYRGQLANGRVFDSTSTGQPRSFDLRTTIRGFQTGLAGARAGARRRLLVPPAQGYGSRTTGRIPAGSVLVFEIDIDGVTTPTSTPSASALPR